MLYLLFADAAVVFANDPLSLQSMLKDIEVHILCNKSALMLNVNNINWRDVQRKYVANNVDRVKFLNS